MRIRKIKAHDSAIKLGLKPFDLSAKPLGALVALVGKNGAGKTRVLNLVEKYFEHLKERDIVDDYVGFIPKELISAEQQKLDYYRKLLKEVDYGELDEYERVARLDKVTEAMKYLMRDLRKSAELYIKVIDSDALVNVKTRIENGLNFNDILNNKHLSNVIREDSGKDMQEVNSNEFQFFNTLSTVEHFEELSSLSVNNQFNLFIQNKNDTKRIDDGMKEHSAYNKFKRFQFLLNKFLGKDFTYGTEYVKGSIKSKLLLNGRDFDLKMLSPGQKILFAYAVLLYYQEFNSGSNIGQSIIIIDEPEKHLHPEAQILVIDTIKDLVSERGQLWIATHSINILSHLEHDEIILIDNDEVFPPSRTTPGKSFHALMGLERHIDELNLFVNSISQWAYANFMVQCFKEPEVVFSTNTKDPQYKLFLEFISRYDKLNLLDYGAGKGRIGYTIQEDNTIKDKILYHAYEPDKGTFEVLSKVPNIVQFVDEVKKIESKSIDCVLLCNVLHEMNPRLWEKEVESIRRVLKPDGYLLVVEDRFLPKGETAHEFGYLILGAKQIKKLFCSGFSDNPIELKLEDANYKDRIVFCAIKGSDISYSFFGVRDAINSLKEECFTELKKMRSQKKNDAAYGRQYANVTQLYINAQMALEQL